MWNITPIWDRHAIINRNYERFVFTNGGQKIDSNKIEKMIQRGRPSFILSRKEGGDKWQLHVTTEM